MTIPRTALALPLALALGFGLAGCAGGGAPAQTSASGGGSAATAPADAGSSPASSGGSSSGSSSGGSSSGSQASALEFKGFPAEVAGYTTDDAPTGTSAYYYGPNNLVVIAGQSPGTFKDTVAIHGGAWQPAPNTSCGTFGGDFICAIDFSGQVVDFTAFETKEEADAFVLDFLAKNQ